MGLHRYDVYGVNGLSLDEARSAVARALDIELLPRESGYYGGGYYRYRVESGSGAMLFRNALPNRDDHVRDVFRAYDVLLEVSDLDDMDGVQNRLSAAGVGFTLLESSTLDD